MNDSRLCLKTRSGFERPFSRLAASGCIDDRANIACFAVFARRKKSSLSGRRGSFQTEPNADFGGIPGGLRSSESGLVDIFLAQQPKLRRIAAGMGLGPSDVEDVLQDVSIKALEGPEGLETKEQIARWLIRVTINRCITEHRRRKTFRRHASQILAARPQQDAASKPAAQKVIRAEELEIVRESLQELDETLLPPLVLRYFCQLNSTEIAETLELSASTVRSRLRDARMILARSLQRRGLEA